MRKRHCQERLKVSKRRWPRTKESNAAVRETLGSSRRKLLEARGPTLVGQRPKENGHKHSKRSKEKG